MLKAPPAPPPPVHRVQRSLFGEILDWMLAPLLVLWPMSLGLTWVVAQSIASGPFDRELADVALALARQATELEASGLADSLTGRQQMQRTAEQLVHNDDGDEDRVYFQVLGRKGELLAGDASLTVPVDVFSRPPGQGVAYRDDVLGEEPVRVAYVWLSGPLGDSEPQSESDALVQVAETMGRRSLLATEIIKGVILPQFVILPVAVVLVWFALARGIQPLAELQQRIRRRQVTDLSPIDDGNVPDEVAPLVAAINDLLLRLDASIATQRHFLADAAHQLKTPLAGLRTQAEVAAREIESGQTDPALLRHSLLQIALSSQRAAHMVNQLLAMARAEDGGEVLRRVPLDLAVMTRAVVRDFVSNAFERRIDLGYEGPEGAAPLRLLGEPVLLSELIRNLVDNALRYTPAGGTITARVLPDPFGQMVVLQVEDTGPGIAPAEREAVFRPFYRSTEVQVDGSGLGLAIVLEIAQRHGAEVELTDARPRSGETEHLPGALFTVRFAALPAAGSAA